MSGYIMHIVDEHPVPSDPDEIVEAYPDDYPGDIPNEPTRHDYMDMIAKHGEYDVFRVDWPLGNGDLVYILNREFAEGIAVQSREAEWHRLVNVFAEIVDAEGDCRDADYSDNGTRPSGTRDQQCESCGKSWSMG